MTNKSIFGFVSIYLNAWIKNLDSRALKRDSRLSDPNGLANTRWLPEYDSIYYRQWDAIPGGLI